MFNLTGSEIAFLVIIGLVVLGPEKLPEAVRKFTKAYNEFKKMATGFQGEVKQAFDEPMRELRGTADAMKKAADFDIGLDPDGMKGDAKKAANEAKRREAGLNFGNPTAKRQERTARDTANPEVADTATADTESASE